MLASYLAQQFGGRGNVFSAQAIVTSLGIYSTAAGTGGPLLWNGSAAGGGRGVTAFILAVSYGVTTASTVAGAVGITGNSNQGTTAPTSTTAIDSVTNLNLGGPSPACTAYRVGTPSSAGNFFLPTGQVGTAAVTADVLDDNFIHLGGLIQVSTGDWAAVAASATLTSAVMQIGLVWIEIPND